MIKREKNSYNLQDTGILVSLYGRESLIIDVLNAVSKYHRVLLKGPSGVGKTALVIALRESIVKDYPDSICLHHECESRAHNLRSFLGSLTKQILQTKTVTRVNWESCLAKMKENFGTVAVRTGATWLLDVVKKHVPGLETSIKEVYASATEGDPRTAHLKAAEGIVSQSEKEFLPVFIDILKGLSTAETKNYILLDRCEEFSSEVRDGIRAICECLPDNWNIIVSVNDEKVEGVDALDDFETDFRSKNILPIDIPPIDFESFEKWANASLSTSVPERKLHKIHESCDGRPLFLAEWLSNIDLPIKERVLNNLHAYYVKRLNSLSYHARYLAQILSLFPYHFLVPDDITFKLLEGQLWQKINDAQQELINRQFIRKFEGSKCKFIHELAQKQVLNGLAQPAKRQAANTVLSVLERHTEEQGYEDSAYAYISYKLRSFAERCHELLADGPNVIERLQYDGSYIAALDAIEIYRKNAQSIKDNSSFIYSILRNCECLWHMGSYGDALSQLNTLDKFPKLEIGDRATKYLLKGRVLLRLNKYKESSDCFKKALDIYISKSDQNGALKVENELNTIQRDIGNYNAAVNQARLLVSKAEKRSISIEIQVQCYRSLVRSLAFFKDWREGEKIGAKALQVAKENNLIKAVGNCHLSLGECYRHGGQLQKAIHEYKDASRIAQKIANRDSFLWSQMRLADTYFILGETSNAKKNLGLVQAIVEGREGRYPLESLHWKLSEASIKFVLGEITSEDLAAAANGYDDLGISWPHNYVDALINHPKFPEVKNL